MLNKNVIYAVTGISDLIQNFNNVPMRIEEISKRQNLPLQYMFQLFRKLRISGIVESVRGNGGGVLLKNKDVTVLDIIKSVENLDTLDKESNSISHKIENLFKKSLENSLNIKVKDLC